MSLLGAINPGVGRPIFLQEFFFGKPQRLFLGMDGAFGLGFGYLVEQLADDGAGVEVEAAHEFFRADELRGYDAGAISDIAAEEQADGGDVLFPGGDGNGLLLRGAELGAACGDVVGQREEGYGNAGGAEIDEVATDGTRGDRGTLLAQLAGAHVMGGDLLDEATILCVDAEAFHDVLDKRDAGLWMAIEMDMVVFIDGVSGGFADVVQQGGKLHGRRCEHGALENALLFGFDEQLLDGDEVARCMVL